MESNEYHIISPVENLQNIAGVTPIDKRNKKKKQQNPQKKNKKQDNHEEKEEDQTLAGNTTTKFDEHSIDYRA